MEQRNGKLEHVAPHSNRRHVRGERSRRPAFTMLFHFLVRTMKRKATQRADTAAADFVAQPTGPWEESLLSRWLFDLRLAQESGRLFRRRGIDIEPGSPLKARDFGQLRNNLDVPVIVVVNLFADWWS